MLVVVPFAKLIKIRNGQVLRKLRYVKYEKKGV
jgi:hypothetical protein